MRYGALIFSSVVGSHLYGLNHADSDLDVYEVYEGDYPKLTQSIKDDYDVVKGTLNGVLGRAFTGSHQTVELLFSTKKVWESGMFEKYGAFVESVVITGGDVFVKYERTIKKFCYGDFKRRVHACRLSINLLHLRKFGRFDPTMLDMEIVMSRKLAELYTGEELFNKLL